MCGQTNLSRRGSDEDCGGGFSLSGGGGFTDVAVFRPETGLWAVKDLTRFYFGAASDIPVPGDYTAEGVAAPAVFQPTSGSWAVCGLTRVYFGASGDIPAAR